MNNVFKSIVFLLSITICSCNKNTPAGFWTSYKKHNIKGNVNDQGPRGGHRAIYWKAEVNTFNSRDIIDYAATNSWRLFDSIEVNEEQLKNWTYDSKPVFPLANDGFSPDSVRNISTYAQFPRQITESLKVYSFKTGWLAIEPGTDDSLDVNGFVLLSNAGDEMAVYHLWGE